MTVFAWVVCGARELAWWPKFHIGRSQNLSHPALGSVLYGQSCVKKQISKMMSLGLDTESHHPHVFPPHTSGR